MSQVRLDRWLAAARLFKSRTQCTEACELGKVRLNGVRADPDSPVRVGDRLEIERRAGDRALEVKGLGDKRLSPALARELYVDHTPAAPPDPLAAAPRRERGAGRPTKQERRALDKLVGD